MKRSLHFHKNCYRSEDMSDKEWSKLQAQLQSNPLFTDVYLITPASNSSDMLEFYHSRQLAQTYYENRSLTVVGVAASYSDAVKLVEQIMKDCLAKRGDCNLKEYLLC